ncbi:MAG: LPS export ABC transporter periplasmic protein LptC [Candidatus Thiodiazotropha sp. 6PDIVS]
MNRRLLGLSLILALVLSLAWWVNELSHPEVPKRQVARDVPDSYAVDLQVKQFDENGELLQTLQTPKMVHYEKRGITELSKPLVWRFRPGTPPWRVQAEHGVADHQQETLYLPGKVVMKREGKGDFAPYQIETEELTFKAKNSYASTAEAVNIQSGQQRISAIGLEAWLAEPSRLKLLHQVRGYYEFK